MNTVSENSPGPMTGSYLGSDPITFDVESVATTIVLYIMGTHAGEKLTCLASVYFPPTKISLFVDAIDFRCWANGF